MSRSRSGLEGVATAVERPGVELHAEALLPPQRIGPQLAQRRVEQHVRRVGRPCAAPDERRKGLLEGLPEVGSRRFDEPTQTFDPLRAARELPGQRPGVHEAPHLGAMGGRVQIRIRHVGRQVGEETLHGRAGRAARRRHLPAHEPARLVEAHAGPRGPVAAGEHHVDDNRSGTVQEPEVVRRRAMAEQPPGPDGQDRGHRHRVGMATRVTHRVDAVVLAVKPPRLHATTQLSLGHPEVVELPGRPSR